MLVLGAITEQAVGMTEGLLSLEAQAVRKRTAAHTVRDTQPRSELPQRPG